MDHQTLKTLFRPKHQISQFVLQASSSAVRSRLGQNILSLYALQFANYVLPLITIPYLVRVLGPEKFGAVAFGQSLIMYLVLLVEYGFNWSATRTVAAQQGDLSRVGQIASAVLSAKLLLCGLSFLLLTGLILCVPRLREISVLLYILFGVVLGHALFPQWLFQGLERMVEISAINMGMRVLATVSVFAAIHMPEDYLIYAGLLGFQWVGAGIFGLIWANRRLSVPLNLPSWREIIQALQNGWAIFLSTVTISLYTTGNTFILGMLTDNTTVGFFAAGEKLIRAISGLLYPIVQGYYPRISASRQLASNRSHVFPTLLLIGIGILLTLFTFGSASLMVKLLFGSAYIETIIVIKILSFVILNLAMANVWSTWFMIGLGMDRAVLLNTGVAALLNIALALVFIPYWRHVGMAVAWLVSETWINLFSFWYTWKQRTNPIYSFWVRIIAR